VAVGFGEKGEKGALATVITDTRLARVLLAAGGPDKDELWHQTLRERGLVGNREPIFVAKDAPVAQAFEKMAKNKVRAVCVIEKDFEESKRLCGMISASDLAMLFHHDLEDRISPAAHLPAELKLTVTEFLQWRDAAAGGINTAHPQAVLCASREDTVEDCIKKIVSNEVHKLYVVNSEMNIIGVVTLKDLIAQYVPQK
jgi:CBS domain-containing protein